MLLECKAEYIDNKSVIYGYGVIYPDGSASVFSVTRHESFSVKPNSIRMSTGIHSLKGIRLFEGDKIRAYRRSDAEKKDPVTDTVIFLNGCWMVFNCNLHELYRIYQSDWEIVK